MAEQLVPRAGKSTGGVRRMIPLKMTKSEPRNRQAAKDLGTAGGPSSTPETLAFIYEHIKDAPERQAQEWRDLDTKLFQVFTAASVVLGLAGVATASKHSWWGSGFLILALGAYAIVVVAVFRQLRPQTIQNARFGDTLWPDFRYDRPDEVQHGIVQYITEVIYPANKKVLEGKAAAIQKAFLATAAEVAFVVIAVIVARLA